MRRLAGLALAVTAFAGCADEGDGRPLTGLEGLAVTQVNPAVAVEGTTLVLEGRSFIDDPIGISWLRLAGTLNGANIDVLLPADFVDFEHLNVLLDQASLDRLGANSGEFNGTASVVVDYQPEASRFASPPLAATLSIRPELEPQLEDVGSGGGVFVNDAIPVTGSGLFLTEGEGTTFAVLEGCFTPLAETECNDIGSIEVPVVPEDPFDRSRGNFAFSPIIAGILPGTFEGEVTLRNDHASGPEARSDTLSVTYDLLETQIDDVSGAASLGQYIDISGGGFVGEEGLTLLTLNGEYVEDDAVGGVPVVGLDIIPEFVDGRLVRYVISEEDALGIALDNVGGVRYAAGTFDGTLQAEVSYQGQVLTGPQTPITFRIEPVKQVVLVQFNTTYVDSLHNYGLRALDQRIRDRIIEVLERDYETVNVELRTEVPEDFKLFATVEIAGPDPNGLGLLGYDNTPGKDTNNERLFDSIGGVNATTQEDGFPGFGGVFIDSLFTFSEHPPNGPKSEVATPLFDDIFDPFRASRGGTPVTSADMVGDGIPVLTNGAGCPTSERRLQAACAVWVLGSVVGSTVSHELGHSLGLADPLGTRFHNIGDQPNALMDQGGARGFEERAQLSGQGPSRYCVGAYEYLREVLPTSVDPTTIERPPC